MNFPLHDYRVMAAPNAIKSLEGIGTPSSQPRRTTIRVKFSGIAHHLLATYRSVTGTKGYFKVNRWLFSTLEKLKLGRTGLPLTSSSEKLSDYCEQKARKTGRQIYDTAHATGKERVPEQICAAINRSEIDPPPSTDHTEGELITALARVPDDKWWKQAFSELEAAVYIGMSRSYRAQSRLARARDGPTPAH